MLDVNGIGFFAYLLGKVAHFLGLNPAPWLLDLLGAVLLALIVVIVILTIVPGFVWAMRKVFADIGSRHGPTRVGPFGLLQTLADGLKLMTKETFVPTRADRLGYKLAPYLALVPVLLAFAPLPWSKGVILGNIGAGILFILAIGAISPLGEVLAGWSSNNKYSMYGGLRAAALDVSYEIPMVISAIAVVFLAGTLNTEGIVAAQQPWWFFVLQPLGVVIFFIAAIAKIGVIPTDLAEAESELVAGYMTEYTGIEYGVFFLALFANVFLMAAITTTLFFGGWALLPPFGVALVTLCFAGILLTRQPGTDVNLGPPAIMATVIGTVVTWVLHPFDGAFAQLIATAWNGGFAAHFFGPGATPGNFLQTFGATWDFLVPTALVAAFASMLIVKAEGGKGKDVLQFPAICLATVAVPPLLAMPLAPFLAAGTQGGIVHFLGLGLQTLLVPWTGTLNVLGLLFLLFLVLGLLLLATSPLAAQLVPAAGLGQGVAGVIALALAGFAWIKGPAIDLSALIQLLVLLALPAIPVGALLLWDEDPRMGGALLALGLAAGPLLVYLGILPMTPFIVVSWLMVGAVAAGITLLQGVKDPVLVGTLLLLVPQFVVLMLVPLGSFVLKSLFFSFTVFWLWFTLPRVRVDQFLRIGWKTMFPLSLVTLLLAGIEAFLLRGGAL